MNSRKLLLFVTLGSTLGLVAYALLPSRAAPTSDPTPALKMSPRTSQVPRTQAQAPKVKPASPIKSPEVPRPPKPQRKTKKGSAYDLEKTLAEVRRLLAVPHGRVEHAETLAKYQMQLRVLASKDAQLRAELIEQTRNDPHSEFGRFSRSVLGQLDRPEVKSLAKDWLDSEGRDDILAGAELLSELAATDADVVDRARELLDIHGDDPEVVTELLSATRAAKVSESASQDMAAKISKLIRSEDPKIQSAAIDGLEHWATQPEQLMPLVDMLKQGRPLQRSAAAMGLANSSLVSEELQSAMLDRVGDQSERFEVRRMLADAMDRFQLSAQDRKVLAKFRQEQEQIVREGRN